jgi:hypothetical protein
MKRCWFVAVILVTALSASRQAPLARSAPPGERPGLTMLAEAAFDGYFKYGEWLPIWVQLENSGPDLQAEVQVRVTGSWGSTVFAAPAPLPTGSRKRIPVYVLPNNFSQVLNVQLVMDDGTALLSQEVPVKSQPNISYLVGIVATERGALSFLSNISLPGMERPKVAVDVALADMPERAEGWRSFDCLIVNDTDTSSLSPGQKTALESWVRQGGRLVIGGGAGALRTTAGLPQDLLPLSPSGEAEMNALPALPDFAQAESVRVPGPFVVATGDAADGYTLIDQAGLPLLRERSVGAGFVDFVALDLATSPFDAWTGTTSFWERLLARGASYPEWLPPDVSPRQMKSGQMTYALTNLPSLDLPSVRGLGLLLIVYILLVGPANYLFLRWRKGLAWAWVSIPLITLAFSAGAFGLGYALRGSDLILNKVALIQLQSDGTADVTTYLGLFSPARQAYEIEVAGSGLLSPLSPDYNPWGPGGIDGGGEVVFVQGEPSRVRGLAVNQWSMQTFMTEGQWVEFGHIEGDLAFEGETLVGSVRNQSPYALTDTVLVLGNSFVRLGDLAPYASAPARMELTDSTAQGFGQPLSFRLFQEQLTQSGPTGPPREAQLKQMVIQSVFDQGTPLLPTLSSWSGAGSAAPQQLALLGWLDQAPPEVQVAGRAPAQQTTALLYAPIAYHLPGSGDISLPPGMLPGSLVQIPIEGGRCGPQANSVWLGRGEAIFEFQVPDEVRDAKVEQLKLLMQSDGSGWWQPPDTAVYAWDSEGWVAVDEPVLGLNIIPDAASMVGPDGRIRVRLSAESNQGGCLYLELGMQGTR